VFNCHRWRLDAPQIDLHNTQHRIDFDDPAVVRLTQDERPRVARELLRIGHLRVNQAEQVPQTAAYQELAFDITQTTYDRITAVRDMMDWHGAGDAMDIAGDDREPFGP
jgi:hypothetical protein